MGNDLIDRTFRGGEALRVTVGDTSAITAIDDDDAASTGVLDFEGTITAARRVALSPVDGWSWIARNGCAFALEVGGLSGARVTLAAGEVTIIVASDGAFARVGAAGSGVPSVQSYTVTADATLSHGYADADLLVLGGAAQHITTFPVSVRDGAPIVVWNQSGATQTVGDQDGSTYDVVAGAAITLQRAGSQLVLTSLAPFGSNTQVLLGTGQPSNVPDAAIITIGGVAKAALVAGAALGATSVQPSGTSVQVILGDGTKSSLPVAALPSSAAPAIDANHTHVYAAEEISGATIADTGSATHRDLTIAGTENLAFRRAASGLYLPHTNRRATRLFDGVNSAGAVSAVVAGMIPSAAAITIEAYFQLLKTPSYSSIAIIMSVDDNSTANAFWMGHVGGGWQCSLKTSTTDHTTTAATPVLLGEPHHLMAVYDSAANPSLKLYLDGAQIGATHYALGSHPAFTKIGLGNLAGNLLYASDIRVAQARISNIARDLAYAAAAYAALRAM